MLFPGSMRRSAAVLAAALVATACSGGGGVPGVAASSTTAAPPTTTTTTEPAPVLCPVTRPRPAPALGVPEVRRLAAADPVAASIAFSFEAFECAADVVVTSTADLDRVALAARLAAGLDAPLLFGGPGTARALDAELARLIPQRVFLIGADVAAAMPEGGEVETLSGDPARLALEVNRRVGGGPARTLPAEDGVLTVAVTVQAIAEGAGLVPSPPPTTTTSAAGSSTTSTTVASGEETAAEEAPLPAVVAGSGERGVAWLVDSGEAELALAAAVAASSSGGLMALVDGDDLRRVPEVGRALRSVPGGTRLVHLVGGFSADASWQLPVLLEGEELPGGGYLLFPGRRLVALYGHAWAPELGALAEQSPEAAVERIRPIAAEYAEEGVVVVPAFEIIATVADPRPGADGDYSNETSLDDIRPLIEAARRAGLYVLLDLQPGRSDFVTQARLYEEFLRLPFVGLALDPEWRLGPDEFDFQQYGSVPAAEVNEVAAWLAGLVREGHLPQKMLLLHQFRLSMLPDRTDIAFPPELAVVIQMDGQGSLEDKYATWAAITAGTGEPGFRWGWKNFYDEDSPMATPEQVLDLDPGVVYVSYQ